MSKFWDLTVRQLNKLEGEERNTYKGSLLAFDPGHTTGWAYYRNQELQASGQLDTSSMKVAVPNLAQLINKYDPLEIVLEEYRVYGWKTDTHAWDELLTSRVIGAIETLSYSKLPNIPLYKQSASIAKTFCTDKKLKAWNFYVPSQKHARDAIRHGCYYILFGAKKK